MEPRIWKMAPAQSSICQFPISSFQFPGLFTCIHAIFSALVVTVLEKRTPLFSITYWLRSYYFNLFMQFIVELNSRQGHLAPFSPARWRLHHSPTAIGYSAARDVSSRKCSVRDSGFSRRALGSIPDSNAFVAGGAQNKSRAVPLVHSTARPQSNADFSLRSE